MRFEDTKVEDIIRRIVGLGSRVGKTLIDITWLNTYKVFKPSIDFKCDDVEVHVKHGSFIEFPPDIKALLKQSCRCFYMYIPGVELINNKTIKPNRIVIDLLPYEMGLSLFYGMEWILNIDLFEEEKEMSLMVDGNFFTIKLTEVEKMTVEELGKWVEEQYMRVPNPRIKNTVKLVVNSLKLYLKLLECLNDVLKNWEVKLPLISLYP